MPDQVATLERPATASDDESRKRAASKYWKTVRTIAEAKRPIAINAIAACDDIPLLRAATNRVLSGAWRRAAVAKRIQQLEKASE